MQSDPAGPNAGPTTAAQAAVPGAVVAGADPPAGTIFPARAVQCVLAFEPPRAGCGTPARASNSAPLPAQAEGERGDRKSVV